MKFLQGIFMQKAILFIGLGFSLMGCLTSMQGRSYALNARQTWGLTQRRTPQPNADLLAKDPVLFYEVATQEGQDVDKKHIADALWQLLRSPDAGITAFKKLEYLQSLYVLGEVTAKAIQLASVDLLMEIAAQHSPGVAIAMIGQFVPLSFLSASQVAYFRQLATDHGLEIPGDRGGSKPVRVSKRDWFKGVVTVWVRAGYIMQRGLSFPKMGVGTGFFIDKKGYLITNYHVIAAYVEREAFSGFSEITIETVSSKPGVRWPVQVIGYNKATDLALLKVEGYEPELAFSFLPKTEITTGDRVFALGSPGGQTETLTSGLVSHTDRKMVMPIGNVIQLDAAVNPGNSGGPMLDEQGRIGGVVFATVTAFQGMSFALPTDTVRAMLPLLMFAEGKSAKLPFLGIGMTEVEEGIEASMIPQGSLMHNAGIASGASILKVAHMSVTQGDRVFADLQVGLLSQLANTLIKVEMIQEGASQEVLSRLSHRSSKPALDMMQTTPVFHLYGPMFGMVLHPLSNTMMFVQKVYPGSPAAMAGIKARDTLTIYQTILATPPKEKEPQGLVSIFRVALETDAGMPRNMVLAGALDANYWL
ncbi:MAG: S1C family serine protease [Spirochaetia bacterium]